MNKKIIVFGIALSSFIIATALWMSILIPLAYDGIINIDLIQEGLDNDDPKITLHSFWLLFLPILMLWTMVSEILATEVKKYGNKKQD
jgi:hypothetical protein